MKSFYRSEDGVIAGVCKGLGEILEVDAGIVRIGFILFLIVGGGGLFAYFALALALPRKDRLAEAYEPKVLGVCSILARKFDIDVGIVRFLSIASLVCSLGITLIFYVVLKLVLSDSSTNSHIRDVN